LTDVASSEPAHGQSRVDGAERLSGRPAVDLSAKRSDGRRPADLIEGKKCRRWLQRRREATSSTYLVLPASKDDLGKTLTRRGLYRWALSGPRGDPRLLGGQLTPAPVPSSPEIRAHSSAPRTGRLNTRQRVVRPSRGRLRATTSSSETRFSKCGGPTRVVTIQQTEHGGIYPFDTAIGRCAIAGASGVSPGIQASGRASTEDPPRACSTGSRPRVKRCPTREVQRAVRQNCRAPARRGSDLSDIAARHGWGPAFHRSCYEVARDQFPRGRRSPTAIIAAQASTVRGAARAVGQGARAKTVPGGVPCHRVLAAGGRSAVSQRRRPSRPKLLAADRRGAGEWHAARLFDGGTARWFRSGDLAVAQPCAPPTRAAGVHRHRRTVSGAAQQVAEHLWRRWPRR